MQQGQDVKQQIVDRIKQSTSILVTVANSPSVDALSSAIGLALMLNKLNKHVTTVFSGAVPPAIQFLEPDKTFESTVDALRDFIISLDKEKADRLRYKVEDDVVRIFITPYRTVISEKDLQYSQGDYNVDLVIALGVEKREDLDAAITSHGRILHDATVITISNDSQKGNLGAIDWNDSSASGLSEMLTSLSDMLQQNILDKQIGTALLTGIVAATERFSNKLTSPRVMTMAAQLMAAGANQQLIATNLEKAQEVVKEAVPTVTAPPVAKQAPTEQLEQIPQEPPKKKEPGELDIVHEEEQKKAEEQLEAALPQAVAQPQPSIEELKKELAEAVKMEGEGREPKTKKAPGSESVSMEESQEEKPRNEEYVSEHGSWRGKRLEPPTMGGTLNATAEEALEDARRAEEEAKNRMVLEHKEEPEIPLATAALPVEVPSPQEEAPTPEAQPQPAPLPTPEPQPSPQPEQPAPVTEPQLPLPPMSPTPQVNVEPEVVTVPKFMEPQLPPMQPVEEPTQAPVMPVQPEPQPNRQPTLSEIEGGRKAVAEAYAAQPFNPGNQPLQSIGAQEMPAMPSMPTSEPLSQTDLQALPPAPVQSSAEPASGELPPMPPMPTDMSTLPPAPNIPGLNQQPQPFEAPSQPAGNPPASTDVGQFKIPGV